MGRARRYHRSVLRPLKLSHQLTPFATGLAKAQYAMGYFTEMGIGCRRDALEANVWYVKAADQGDERAKHRIATIRAAADGANPTVPTKSSGRLRRSEPKGQGTSDLPVSRTLTLDQD